MSIQVTSHCAGAFDDVYNRYFNAGVKSLEFKLVVLVRGHVECSITNPLIFLRSL